MECCILDHPWWLALLILVVIWDVVWRIIGMWHAARRSEKGWFIALSIFSTIGILPIIYLRNRSIL